MMECVTPFGQLADGNCRINLSALEHGLWAITKNVNFEEMV